MPKYHIRDYKNLSEAEKVRINFNNAIHTVIRNYKMKINRMVLLDTMEEIVAEVRNDTIEYLDENDYEFEKGIKILQITADPLGYNPSDYEIIEGDKRPNLKE